MGFFSNLFNNKKTNQDEFNNNNKIVENDETVFKLEGSGSGSKLIKDIYNTHKELLFEFRERYTYEEYSYKLVINIIYQSLQLECMWESIHNNFKIQSKFSDYGQAYSEMMKLKGFAIEAIRPLVEISYVNREKIGNIDLVYLRNLVAMAQNGDYNSINEIEKTYFWYTCGVELMYHWAACVLLGKTYSQATSEICVAIFECNYEKLSDMQTLFGNNVIMEYEPLPVIESYSKNSEFYKDKIVQQHIKFVIQYIESNFPLRVSFSDYIDLPNYDDIDFGQVPSNLSYYKKNQEELSVMYNGICKIKVNNTELINKRVLVCWIAIERDDDNDLVPTDNESFIDIWDFTEILVEFLQRDVVDVGAIIENGTYYRKFSWVIVV